MLPMTLLATNKLLNLLKANHALSRTIHSNAVSAGVDIAPLHTSQIVGSSVRQDMGDLDLQLTYPRVCIYASQATNIQREKFRAFSGVVSVEVDVWSSASLEQQTETALHFYAEGVAALLRANPGDWGDGFRYSGTYGVHLQTPRTGGAGFVQSAQVTCNLEVSFN